MSEMSERERQFLQAQQGMEQFGELLRVTLAPLVASYYHELRHKGLDGDAALTLTMQAQAELLDLFVHGPGKP